MSGDKRKVSTDALETLGTVIDENAGRDAIHLAVEPVIAGEILYPGQDIGLVDGKAVSGRNVKPLGIVDPFLVSRVNPGDRFWLVVYPRKITSLRHVWEHPDFVSDPVKLESTSAETWLRNYADELNITLTDLISSANEYLDDGSYLCRGDDFEGVYTADEFWDHFESYTGRKPKDRGNFFTCSC